MRIRFHRIASAELDANESHILLILHIMWWHRKIDFLNWSPQEEKQTKKKKSSDQKKKKRAFPLKKMMAVIKSFRMHRCIVHFNTGDMALNGILFPLLFWIGHKTGKDIAISFHEETRIEIHTSNTLARIIRAYFSN